MSRVLQQIRVKDDVSIYLSDFNQETQELSFRDSDEPAFLQKEKITIVENNVVKTMFWFFPIGFLKKFITENKERYETSN